MKGDAARTLEAFELAALLRPLFAGREPTVQGAALAEAMAVYLRGYTAEGGDRVATDVLRGMIMSRWLETVHALVLSEDDVAGHA